MIKIAKLNENVYQVDDNELPLENAEVRKLLNSYGGMSDVEANQWLDVLEEQKENTFEPKEANKGVVVNIYEVDYPAPADPNKETQEMSKHLDEYKDFVSQQVFPGSETEDVVVDLRQNIEKQKQPQGLRWQIIPELTDKEKQYILNTGRINYNKLKEYYGFDLNNWIEINFKFAGGKIRALIAKDTFRYLVAIQESDGVAQFEAEYMDLVEEDINPYDLQEVVGFVIGNGPDEFTEDATLDGLIEEEGIDVIKLSSQKLSWKTQRTHQELMDEAYDLWQQNTDWEEENFIDNLPSQAHKDAVILGNLNYQVGNGGFEQWYGNGYGERDDRYLITNLLPRINTELSQQVASLIRKAGHLQRQAEELAENDREEASDDIYEQMDALDSKYYDLNDAFMQECEDYLQRIQSTSLQKLQWAQLPSMKVLRAIKVGNSWMWTNSNEMVIPEVLTNDYGFYGLDTRKGSQYAVVTSEDINMEELAKKDVLGFWGSSVPDKNTLDKLIKEKIHYYEVIQEDLQDIPAGTIIEEIRNPQTGSEWYRVIKRTKQSALKFNWRDLYEEGNPDDFFKTTKCDRCGADLGGLRTMSWFNHDTICWECSKKEYEYKSKFPDRDADLEGKGLPEELTPKSNWRNKLQWRENIPNFVWLPGIKVKFKENTPIENRTFEYEDAEHPYGEDYTIPTNEIGTVVSRNDDPDNDNIEVIFDNLKKLFKNIPLICFKENLELLHPNRLENN